MRSGENMRRLDEVMLDTIECPYCGYINALIQTDYEERFTHKNDEFDIRNYCPLCNWEKFEAADENKKVNLPPLPSTLKEAKKIMEFINETEVDTPLDDLINDYILDKYEDLPVKEKKAETFYKGIIEQVFLMSRELS